VDGVRLAIRELVEAYAPTVAMRKVRCLSLQQTRTSLCTCTPKSRRPHRKRASWTLPAAGIGNPL